MSAENTFMPVERPENPDVPERVTFRMASFDVERMDRAIESGVYWNQSELIRAAVRRELDRIERGDGDGD